MIMAPPYPAEIRLVPRRRHGRAWLAALAAAALVLTAYAWAPKAHPAAHPAVAQHQAAHPAPAKPAMTVTVGRAVYACTVVPTPKARH